MSIQGMQHFAGFVVTRVKKQVLVSRFRTHKEIADQPKNDKKSVARIGKPASQYFYSNFGGLRLNTPHRKFGDRR